jgi:hypothetical protein
LRPRDIRRVAPNAGKILLGNVYGWFERVEKGVYALTEAGVAALQRWPQEPHPIETPPAPAAPSQPRSLAAAAAPETR